MYEQLSLTLEWSGNMSTPESEIQVDLDLATPPPATKVEPKPIVEVAETHVEPPKPVLTPDAGLEKLKKQLDDEKSARIAAEARAHEAAQSELAAKTEVRGSQIDQLASAITAAEQAKEVLKSQYAEALAAQDFAKVADIQSTMADNAANLAIFKDGKKKLEAAPKPTVRAPVDPVEQFASQLTPQSAAWVREHPEYVRDARKNQKMLAAHALAIADGIKADTPEYFESIEQILKIAPAHVDPDPADDPMREAAQEVRPRKSTPAAAPVTRSGNGTGSRSNVIRLSAAQVEAAELSGMTVEEYAKNLAALKAEGKLN